MGTFLEEAKVFSLRRRLRGLKEEAARFGVFWMRPRRPLQCELPERVGKLVTLQRESGRRAVYKNPHYGTGKMREAAGTCAENVEKQGPSMLKGVGSAMMDSLPGVFV